MLPVEQPPQAPGNPDASLCARRSPRRHRHDVGASAARAVRGPCDHAMIAGSAARPHAGPGARRRGHSSGCRGHSGCTARPARGSGRTGTGGRVGPCAPRHNRSAGRTRPKRATLAWHRLHRHGVGRGTVVKLAGKRHRCRVHLLRHRARCTAVGPWRRRATATARVPAAQPLPEPAAPPAPAWPPCRAARQAHTPKQDQAKPSQPPSSGWISRASKPPPHQRIAAVPDQRSQGPEGSPRTPAW